MGRAGATARLSFAWGSHVVSTMCVQVKGNVFKNKRVLMEAIHKQKAEKIREKAIADQFEARRAKGKQSRERKLARRNERFSQARQCRLCILTWLLGANVELLTVAPSRAGPAVRSGHGQGAREEVERGRCTLIGGARRMSVEFLGAGGV